MTVQVNANMFHFCPRSAFHAVQPIICVCTQALYVCVRVAAVCKPVV